MGVLVLDSWGGGLGLGLIDLGGYTYIPGYCEGSVDWDDLVLAGCVDGEGVWGGVVTAWCLIAC